MNEEEVFVRSAFARSGVHEAPPLGLDVADVMRRGRRIRRRRKQFAVVASSVATAGVVSVMAVAFTGQARPHPPVEPGVRLPAITATTQPRPAPPPLSPAPKPEPSAAVPAPNVAPTSNSEPSTIADPAAKADPAPGSDPAPNADPEPR